MVDAPGFARVRRGRLDRVPFPEADAAQEVAPIAWHRGDDPAQFLEPPEPFP